MFAEPVSEYFWSDISQPAVEEPYVIPRPKVDEKGKFILEPPKTPSAASKELQAYVPPKFSQYPQYITQYVPVPQYVPQYVPINYTVNVYQKEQPKVQIPTLQIPQRCALRRSRRRTPPRCTLRQQRLQPRVQRKRSMVIIVPSRNTIRTPHITERFAAEPKKEQMKKFRKLMLLILLVVLLYMFFQSKDSNESAAISHVSFY
jgi:hypothetical protein